MYQNGGRDSAGAADSAAGAEAAAGALADAASEEVLPEQAEAVMATPAATVKTANFRSEFFMKPPNWRLDHHSPVRIVNPTTEEGHGDRSE
jgi:hypothetical protein